MGDDDVTRPGTQPVSQPQGRDGAADPVVTERRQLTNLAYRMLGSLADAEDVVQEAGARWYALSDEQRDAIDNPAAWLTKVTSRICLDVLGSARVRRERYVGEWLPEPVPGGHDWLGGRALPEDVDPADRVTLDESISMAFLVVLESLTPAQRVAFVLHDVFRYSFAEVAEVVGRSPAACRQLATAARRRIDEASPPSPRRRRERAVRAFMEAWAAKDVAALLRVLDPEATAVADGGGVVSAITEPLHGADTVARTFVDLLTQVPDLEIVEGVVNGQPGLVVRHEGTVASVMAFDVADDRVTRVWTMRNPEKLRAWLDEGEGSGQSPRPG